MKRLIFLSLIFVSSLCWGTNKEIESFISKVDSSLISFNYNIVVEGYNIPESGRVDLQGNKFRLQSGSMSVFCNDTLIWLVNPKKKEVVIQDKIDDLDLLSTPFLALELLHNNSNYVIKENQEFNNQKCTKVIINQDNKSSKENDNSDKYTINLYLRDNKLIGIESETDLGKVIVKISKFIFVQKKDYSYFQFNTKDLSDDWIITDLSTNASIK